jgi:CRP/FNR family transcriptional regulator
VPRNRQDIADRLGLTIETVSRAISKLASRNIVVPEDRHDLRIVNPVLLAQLSKTLMISPRKPAIGSISTDTPE